MREGELNRVTAGVEFMGGKKRKRDGKASKKGSGTAKNQATANPAAAAPSVGQHEDQKAESSRPTPPPQPAPRAPPPAVKQKSKFVAGGAGRPVL